MAAFKEQQISKRRPPVSEPGTPHRPASFSLSIAIRAPVCRTFNIATHDTVITK